MPGRAVITRDISLAEIIRLYMCGIAAEEFPVDFIEIIGLEDDAADDAVADGGFHPYLELTEEEVEFGLDCRCVAAGVDGKLGARGTVFDEAGGGVPSAAGGGGDEVVGVVCTKGCVGGAVGGVEGVARGSGLGSDRRCEGGEEGKGEKGY